MGAGGSIPGSAGATSSSPKDPHSAPPAGPRRGQTIGTRPEKSIQVQKAVL